MNPSLFLNVSQRWAERAEAFHRDHPAIYDLLVRYAREARREGCARIGIELLWNRMRWDVTVVTREDDFKLNQNYKAWYAREIMAREPDLAGIFETRSRRGAA